MKNLTAIPFALWLATCTVACSEDSNDDSGGRAGSGGSAGAAGTGGGGATIGDDANWVGTWATAPMLVDSENLPPAPGLSGNTLRQVVLTSIGGAGFRVQLSNAFGSGDLTLEAARAAISVDGDTIDPDTEVALAFEGQPGVTIPAGEEVFSDPVASPLEPMSNVAVTVHFGSVPADLTGHPGSRATSYLASGDATAETSLPSATTTNHWYVLSAIDVAASDTARAVVILGDSITDGYGSTTNANNRWPDSLSRRLRDHEPTREVAVLNLGIGGNAVLSGGLGPTARRRFERDVLQQRGARWLVVFVGVNDIGGSRGLGIADTLIDSYEEFIDVAHDWDLLVYGVPILPFGGSQYDSGDREEVRQIVNDWISTSDRFDAVIDLDSVVRDPAAPAALLSSYDSGDHLHPSVGGYQAMADAIDLSRFADLQSGQTPTGTATLSIRPGYPCTNFEPPSSTINDFSTWSNGSWGDSSTLAGGTFYYDGDGDSSVQALSLTVDADEGGAVTGEVTGGYAGFGFWFGACVDASGFEGISFTITGELGEAQLELQVQTSHNYPIDDANRKGECQGSWSDCGNNKVALELTASGTTTFEVPWADLTGGTPDSTMAPTEILGLQWQLNCASSAVCTPNFVIDDVEFYPIS